MPHIADLWALGPVCQWDLGKAHGGVYKTGSFAKRPGENVFLLFYYKLSVFLHKDYMRGRVVTCKLLPRKIKHVSMFFFHVALWRFSIVEKK